MVVKQFGPPATAREWLLKGDSVGAEVNEDLGRYPTELEAVALLHSIREAHSTLTATS